MKPKNDIPLEAVLKWIKKERDQYKNKLDTLIPYTHTLETKVRALEKEVSTLRNEVAKVSHDVTTSVLYKTLNERYAKACHDKNILLVELGKYRMEEKDHRTSPEE